MRFLFLSCLALALCSLGACETAGTPEQAFGWQSDRTARSSNTAERDPPPTTPSTFEGTGETIVLEVSESELTEPVPDTEFSSLRETADTLETPGLPGTPTAPESLDAPDVSRDSPGFSPESFEEVFQSLESSSDDLEATAVPMTDAVSTSDSSSVRIALLLPLQASRPEVARIAADMRNAAEMALFDLGMEEVALIPFDTGGNTEGALQAMQQAIAARADIVLGPLLASSVIASAPLALENGLTMIAFSNDTRILQENILLLNLSPEQDVEQILSFAMKRGIRDFAAMLPDSAYGERVRSILESYIADAGATLHKIEFYSRVIDGPYDSAQRLAVFSGGAKPPRFRALLLADDGQMLRIAASALAYFDIAPPDVQLLGTHLWDDEGVFEEPALLRGWYPMPRSESYDVFLRRYEEIFGTPPDRIAGLSYDAVSLVGLLVQEGGDWRTEPAPPQMLLRPGGFTGIQGLFRFLPDGRSQRSLAIWEVGEEEAELLQAPRQSFAGGT